MFSFPADPRLTFLPKDIQWLGLGMLLCPLYSSAGTSGSPWNRHLKQTKLNQSKANQNTPRPKKTTHSRQRLLKLKCNWRGTWVAQLVKYLTLDLSFGLNLGVMG